MARKSRKPASGQSSLFGMEMPREPKERKEVKHARGADSRAEIAANGSAQDITGADASITNADEPIGDTVGASRAPAVPAAVACPSAAQPPGVLPTPGGSTAEETPHAQNVGDLRPSEGLSGPLRDQGMGSQGKGDFSLSPGPAGGHDRGSQRQVTQGALQPGEGDSGRSGNLGGLGITPGRLSNKEWDALLARSRGPWTDEEFDRYTAFCPECGRVVWELMPGLYADPLPRERERIVKMLGKRFTAFGKRVPMRNPLGKWVRPAHDCNAPEARPDPQRGWKPPDAHGADTFDMG